MSQLTFFHFTVYVSYIPCTSFCVVFFKATKVGAPGTRCTVFFVNGGRNRHLSREGVFFSFVSFSLAPSNEKVAFAPNTVVWLNERPGCSCAVADAGERLLLTTKL